MSSIKPTHTAIKATKAPGRFRVEGHPGLYLRVRESGSKTWMVRSDAGGTSRYKILGKVDVLPFADAASQARDIRAAAVIGSNAVDTERETIRAAIAAEAASHAATAAALSAHERAEALRPTVNSIAKKYLGIFVSEKRRANGEKRSAKEDRRVYERHVAPKLGEIKLDELRTSMVASMRDDVEAPSERRRAVAVLRALLSQAMSDGLTENNPAIGVKAPPSGRRNRLLSDDEIKALWTMKAIKGVRPPMVAAIKLQLLTAQRAGEVLSMRWVDLDETGKTWTVPSEVAKNGRASVVPLSPQAWSLINDQERNGNLVFPAHRAKERVSTSSYTQLVARVRGKLELASFGSHDLRRTAATRMAGLRVLPHVLEAVLNHSSGIVSGVAAVYNLETYLTEKRSALDVWALEVDRISSDRVSVSNVLVFRS